MTHIADSVRSIQLATPLGIAIEAVLDGAGRQMSRSRFACEADLYDWHVIQLLALRRSIPGALDYAPDLVELDVCDPSFLTRACRYFRLTADLLRELLHAGATFAPQSNLLSARVGTILTRYIVAWSQAAALFMDAPSATTWMGQPFDGLSGRRPLSMMDTEEGLKQVMSALRIYDPRYPSLEHNPSADA